ncbi:MAG: hypothetical protein GWN46_02305, partial [Gammaproteobacteria bacterium]|nr:hypothetical protein [Gammaproteobacteria bacterium]
GETRFYNKSAIVRMDYISMDAAPSWQAQGIPCTLSMIDGTALFGRLREGLTNEEQRLLDYLNRS